MSARISAFVWAATTLLVVALLARNILAIPSLVPLDPNEGWNAAHTLSLLAKGALYPPPDSLMVNNYPPLRSEERRVGKECRSRWSPYH